MVYEVFELLDNYGVCIILDKVVGGLPFIFPGVAWLPSRVLRLLIDLSWALSHLKGNPLFAWTRWR